MQNQQNQAEQPKGYFQKIVDFGMAVKEQGYESIRVKDPKDFVEVVTNRVGRITGLATAVAERDTAVAVAQTQGLRNQEYRDAVEPYESACFSAQEFAAISIDGMNRMFEMAGQGKFADIDTKNNAAVQKVAGDIVIEALEGQAGLALQNTFNRAVAKEKEQPGAATRRLYDVLAKQNKDGGEGVAGPEVR